MAPDDKPKPADAAAGAAAVGPAAVVPVLSIATIVRNDLEGLMETFASVALQEVSGPIEHVIYDGSTTAAVRDMFLEMEKRQPWLRYYSIEDCGVYDAMNIAIAGEAVPPPTGTFVIFLNAGDTFVSNRTVERMLNRLNVTGVDIVYGSHFYVQGMGREFLEHPSSAERFRAERRSDAKPLASISTWFPCHQATVYRMSYLRAWPFDLSFRIAADHKLLVEAYAKGARFDYFLFPVARYKSGGLSGANLPALSQEWAAVRRSLYGLRALGHNVGSADAFQDHSANALRNLVILSGAYNFESVPGQIDFGFWMSKSLILNATKSIPEGVIEIICRNQVAEQALTVFHNGVAAGRIQMPNGMFDRPAAYFIRLGTVLPGDTIEVRGEHVYELGWQDPRVASVFMEQVRVVEAEERHKQIVTSYVGGFDDLEGPHEAIGLEFRWITAEYATVELNCPEPLAAVEIVFASLDRPNKLTVRVDDAEFAIALERGAFGDLASETLVLPEPLNAGTHVVTLEADLFSREAHGTRLLYAMIVDVRGLKAADVKDRRPKRKRARA